MYLLIIYRYIQIITPICGEKYTSYRMDSKVNSLRVVINYQNYIFGYNLILLMQHSGAEHGS